MSITPWLHFHRLLFQSRRAQPNQQNEICDSELGHRRPKFRGSLETGSSTSVIVQKRKLGHREMKMTCPKANNWFGFGLKSGAFQCICLTYNQSLFFLLHHFLLWATAGPSHQCLSPRLQTCSQLSLSCLLPDGLENSRGWRKVWEAEMELDLGSSLPLNSFCANLDHFFSTLGLLLTFCGMRFWSQVKRKRMKGHHVSLFCGSTKILPQEFWIVFPHVGCGGGLGKDERQRGVHGIFFCHSNAS